MISALPKPHLFSKLKRLLAKRKPVSYIAALRCLEGVVLVADTQETIADQKQYCEKLTVSEKYPIAVGGAGIDEITDAFSQEVISRIESTQPTTEQEIATEIKSALRDVYQNDVPISAIPKQYRTAAFIVAVKSGNDRVAIFRTQGKRVYSVANRVIIGYATAPNNALLKRLHQPLLTMHRTVLLATYLVSQSKMLDEAVGGETRVALVTPYLSCFDNPAHIASVEARAKEFISIMDELFLESADLTTHDVPFAERLEEYKARILKLRNEHKRITAGWFFSEPERIVTHDSPYPYLPPGFVLTLMGDGTTSFSEDQERLDRMREMVTRAQSHSYFFKCECGAEVEYLMEGTGGGTLISHSIPERDIAIGNIKGERRTLGKIKCPDCKKVRATPAKVTRYRKIGATEWIETNEDVNSGTTPSTSEKSKPVP